LKEDSSEFKTLIEERIKDEKEATKSLYDSIKKAKNSIVRLMLYQLALDSVKHEHMLRTILRILEFDGTQDDPEIKEFPEIVKKHVELENNMLRSFERIVERTADKRIRFILQEIVSDERKHHAIVKRISELISDTEEVRDEKWWDFLYRYSHLSQ